MSPAAGGLWAAELLVSWRKVRIGRREKVEEAGEREEVCSKEFQVSKVQNERKIWNGLTQ